MEIRDPVHGTIVIEDAEVKVIESPQFQRLRLIKQLGFAEFSFPGATHNRYLHSIGVCHLAGQVFDAVFSDFKFSKQATKGRLRQVFRLAALLHDIGHGPLSHTTEEVMPPLADLKVAAYAKLKTPPPVGLQANHEDYTIKILTDSGLTQIMREAFPDIDPFMVACLIDQRLTLTEDFFIDQGFDFRPILSQLVSSELDCDRMDYLVRDSYFCGTNYGKVELGWLIANMNFHQVDGQLHLALNRRAIYTFDDFLISRHHMHLMVYFHHKAIVYEEMLGRYLTSKDCTYRLPADLDSYLHATDYSLYEHLASVQNKWAKRIAERRPFKVLSEIHSTTESPRPQKMVDALNSMGIEVIHASSQARLSKYHTLSPQDLAFQIFVVDQYDRWDKPVPIEECTEIFKKYEGNRIIDRLYVAPQDFEKAEHLLKSKPF